MPFGAVWRCSWLAERGCCVRIPVATTTRHRQSLSKLVLQTFLSRQLFQFFIPSAKLGRLANDVVTKQAEA